MGAETFVVTSKGKTAREAFRKVVEDARHEYGHGGYTGSIAEKTEFRMVSFTGEEMKDARGTAEELCCDGPENAFYQDKWGPAACVSLGNDSYLFFGWASS